MAKREKRTKKRYSGIGGQAVMEGIMMKNKDNYAVAVRKPDGEIEVMTEEYKPFFGGAGWTKLPFIRGVFSFVDSLVLGMKCLTWSAEFYDEEPEEEKKENKKGTVGEAENGLMTVLAVVISFGAAIGLFMLIPYFVSRLLKTWISSEPLIALLEGVLRVLIFVLYVALISLMKDIRRVYMYHGAEHKCINCIERGYELNVANVKKASRQHKRCGTSFLLFVMLVSVIMFIIFRSDNPLIRIVIRIVLIPVIAGVSYEIIRLAGSSDNFILSILSAPGMWLQKLTTREPDDDMIEVAIASIEAVFDWKKYMNETFGTNYEIDEEE